MTKNTQTTANQMAAYINTCIKTVESLLISCDAGMEYYRAKGEKECFKGIAYSFVSLKPIQDEQGVDDVECNLHVTGNSAEKMCMMEALTETFAEKGGLGYAHTIASAIFAYRSANPKGDVNALLKEALKISKTIK